MRVILSVAVVALLVACEAPAGTPGDAATAPPADSPSAADDAVPPADDTAYAEGEPRWMSHQDGENRILAFAVPETDDVRLTISCGPGERTVRLWREVWEGDNPTFQLASGEVTTSYPGEVDPEGMAPQLNGVAPAHAPVFMAFQTTGQLTMTAGGEARDVSAPPGALPQIAAFFDYCAS
ncbi:MAG: hypothetical protein J0L52_12810 [Caulobacterales bacterium]|nr:hypothetical protein [Caulobacterales bacterium]